MSKGTVSTRFLIISDTHEFQFDDAAKVDGAFRPPVPKADVLLHCGDLTMVGALPALRECLKMIGSIEAELKLVIAGNHDLTLDKEHFEGHFDQKREDPEEHKKAMRIMKGAAAKEAGITYLEEGTYDFTLKNGAKFTVYASPYQPEFYDWAFQYKPNEDRWSRPNQVNVDCTSIAVNPIPDFGLIDIVMTHGPPQYILDECKDGNVGCNNLLRAISRCRPRIHCFGHIHEGHGAEIVTWRPDTIGEDAIQSEWFQKNEYPKVNKSSIEFGKETLMVNAAIMNVHNDPVNKPWIVDLDLPCAE